MALELDADEVLTVRVTRCDDARSIAFTRINALRPQLVEDMAR